jgi:rare lipoprotein A
MNKLTGAHLRLPLPTRVLVENPRNGSAIVIKVNDRGPYAKNRVMDLSREGAKQLGTLGSGVGYVECMVLPTVASSKGSTVSKNSKLRDGNK